MERGADARLCIGRGVSAATGPIPNPDSTQGHGKDNGQDRATARRAIIKVILDFRPLVVRHRLRKSNSDSAPQHEGELVRMPWVHGASSTESTGDRARPLATFLRASILDARVGSPSASSH